MTNSRMKSLLNSEMLTEGKRNGMFYQMIEKSFTDNNLHTVLQFEYPTTIYQQEFLQNRFSHGVTVSNRGMTISINHPNESNK